MLVDDDMLIDAGTGVGDLSLAELTQIDHVFITHSYLDHIACIPFMVDMVGENTRSSAAAFLLTQRGFRASLLEGGLRAGRQGGSASGNGQGASAS